MTMKWAAPLVASVCFLGTAQAQFPGGPDSFKFAVIGDTGTGGRAQFQVGARLAQLQKAFPFNSVLMLGDNLYGSQKARDFVSKFEHPYADLLTAGVKFYAALGNHDAPSQQSYERFNMGGRNYYSFQPMAHVRFFALDSNRVDRDQLAWLQKELAQAGDDWKIAFFHHPLYSSAMRHGSSLELRAMLEPIFAKYGVAAVFAGHDHTYERVKPQKGVTYFVVGGSSKLRANSVRPGAFTAKSFDTDNSFALFEIDKDTMYFRAVSRTGKVVDEGSLLRPGTEHVTTSAAAAESAHQ
jgi:3',5'-cyclic AMP phosphodiesterase CpdA